MYYFKTPPNKTNMEAGKIKKYSFIMTGALAMILLSLDGYSQSGYLRGSNGSQIGVGFTDVGVMANVYYTRNFGQTVKGLFGGGATIGRVADVDYYAVWFDGIGSQTLLGNRSVKLNGLLGASIILDGLEDFESDKLQNRFSVNYGVLTGIEMEFELQRGLSAVIAGQIRYYVRESFGQVRYQGYVGLNFTIGR